MSNKVLIENKKGYKKTKLGWIPEEWEVYKSAFLFRNVSRKNNKDETLLSVTQNRGVIPRSMVESRIAMPEGSTSSYKLVECGDFVISLRSFQGGVEYSNYRGIVSPAYTVIKNNIDIVSGYYKQWFKSYEFITRLGVAIIGIRDGKQISYEDFSSLPICYPPLLEQKKIAEVLSCWDEGIEVLEKLLEQKQLLKKALMQGLLSGKIPLKNSQKNNSYKKTILGKIPSNWTVVKLKNIFTRLEERNSKKSMLPVLTNSATQGVLYQNEYFDRSIVSENNTNNYYIVYPNAFMYNPRISKNAPAGPININKLGKPGIASPLYTIFYSKNELCNKFYALYFNTNLWNKYMFNVANQGARHDRLNVTTKDFMNMPLPYPPVVEQQKIAEILNSCDEEIKLLDKKLAALKQQKKGLMQKLLTGEIRVKV